MIPEGCHWEEIRQRDENLGSAIVEALRLIEQANPDTLYGVLSAFSTANFTDKSIISDERFRNLIEHLWVKKADRVNKILMVDGSKILTQKRAQNILTDEDVDRLYALYSDFADEEDFAKVVPREEVAEKGYDLSVNKYVQYHKEAVKSYAEVKSEFDAALENVRAATEKFRALLRKRGLIR